MKKLLLFLLLFGFAGGAMAYTGGFNEPAVKTTVKEALKQANNTYVTVQGNIVKRLSDDKYLFKDATGTMTVEIDNDKWLGQTTTAKDKLELSGEIEKQFNSTTLDVDSVKKITK